MGGGEGRNEPSLSYILPQLMAVVVVVVVVAVVVVVVVVVVEVVEVEVVVAAGAIRGGHNT